ncbi:MAG: helix-turn-helix domain-containing protein [Brevibacillus sp.]|nr:helix-turn-helix domain-containing protein [Brevibacillus sp.]
MTFGTRLKQLRKQQGLSQQELASRVGLNRSTYARYETDDNQADYETLQKLADFFGTSIDYLLGRTDVPHPLTAGEPQADGSPAGSRDLQAIISEAPVLYFGGDPLELSAEEQEELLRHMRLAWMLIKEKRQEHKASLATARGRKPGGRSS